MTACGVAFKEWAVVCEALARGRQTIILRKGGIHEGREGFRVAHSQFWLLPTKFHASPDALVPEASELMAAAETMNKADTFLVRHFAVVERVIELAREEEALALAGLHLWSESTVRQRFHYKNPGLFCLAVRVFATNEVHGITDTPAIAGCRSWVELPTALSTDGLTPAVDDDRFAEMLSAVQTRLTS